MDRAEGSEEEEAEGRSAGPRRVFVYRGQESSVIPREVTHVTVDPSVKTILLGTFSNCKHLVEAELCEGLEKIGAKAFQYCTSLKRMKIPSTVKEINENAFDGCEQLVEVELCEGLEQIGAWAFQDCISLKHMRIPSTVKVINKEAFCCCGELMEVELCKGLERIGRKSFKNCISLKCVKIPPTVKVIDDDAFFDCEILEEVEICEGLEQIGGNAFHGCISLKCMKIPSTVKVIDYGTFLNCKELAKVELCKGLERIEMDAFHHCISLKHIEIPSTVKNVGCGAFLNCKDLAEVELCEGLERIGREAFKNCISLKCMKIPSTVKEIESLAFLDCKELAEVVLNEGLEEIHDGAFRNCLSLKEMNIPSTTKLIGKKAFRGCHQLLEVVLGAGLKKIRKCAFFDCKSLKIVELPSAVKKIHEHAFGNCDQLIMLVLCESVERVDNYAFQHCRSLRNLSIPSSVEVSCLRGCCDLLQLFGSRMMTANALRSRFDGLPVHKLCYYQSCHSTEEMLKQLKQHYSQCEASPAVVSNTTNHNQDCLGMTPLHILACSTNKSIDLYQLIISNHPDSLITKDKWSCTPILYAIWCNAPRNIIQFLIESQKSAFPNFDLKWEKMIETLCRAGQSLDIIGRVLEIQQIYFSGQSINLQKVAQELAIRCLLSCCDHGDFPSLWKATMEALNASHANQNLIQHMLELQQNMFPDHTGNSWQLLCEQFVMPLKGWWRNSIQDYCLQAFQFLVKCCISERLNIIGIRKWRMGIQLMVEKISSISGDDAVMAHFDKIHSTLVMLEHEWHQVKDTSSLLELALWKSKVDELSNEEQTAEKRNECRVRCGANIIIPNVFSYLINGEVAHKLLPGVWFVERVCVQLKKNNLQAVIREVDGSVAVVETEDKSILKVWSREVTMVVPQEHDMVLVTEGVNADREGELICIGGTDAILKESNGNFFIDDLIHLTKIST